ncbi:MAG: LuxR C-terminal-related transcriptional regulator, partial [Mycobacterium sp.]
QAAASHRAAGRTGSAMTASDRADRLARECGNATSPAIAAARFTLPFTQREREIALLVAQGMSNRDIAEKVSLSVRTIEGHIYRASSKADVAKRTDLARLVNSFAPQAFSRHPG